MHRIRERPVDFIVTSAILGLGIVGLVMALRYPERAGFWPQAIMVMLIAVTGFQMVQFLLAGRPRLSDETRAAAQAHAEEHPAEPPIPVDYARIAINVALVTGLVVITPVLGLFASAAIYLLCHMLFLGIRPLWLAMLIAAGCTLVLYGFFGGLLGVEISDAWLF
ncbi:hypothetical protein LCGC14_1821190 [marine sediment metagenome]|uniref:DUF1468 domain-containing protein n=1 Tax=marine sediment metagenome TaxID=412755 RepID=A0A0F9H731_9ZZZZ